MQEQGPTTTKDPAREKGLQPLGSLGEITAAAVGRRRSTARAFSRWRETLRL